VKVTKNFIFELGVIGRFLERQPLKDSTGPFSTPMASSPFLLKYTTRRISVCQGRCGRPMRTEDGQMYPAPFDLCVARKERRPFISPKDGTKLIGRENDSHYPLASHAWSKQIFLLKEL
jgi:hypothetical protein